MDSSAIIFYGLSAILIVFSLMAVLSRRILRAAVYLLFALGGTAALYLMFDYFFLAAVQLIVYVGGIVVLIIFSILLTTHINERLESPDLSKAIFTAALSLGVFLMTAFVLVGHPFVPQLYAPTETTVKLIGEKMLASGAGGYVLPFEVISILLLAAMIGAIVIAKRTPPSKP
jgi:NADH-quinone oxidoreductase subunit J